MTSTADPRVVQALLESAKHYEDCIFCERKTKQRGLFLPEKKGLFGASDKKYRVIIYAVCWRHTQTEDDWKITAENAEKYFSNHISEFTDITNEVFQES